MANTSSTMVVILLATGQQEILETVVNTFRGLVLTDKSFTKIVDRLLSCLALPDHQRQKTDHPFGAAWSHSIIIS